MPARHDDHIGLANRLVRAYVRGLAEGGRPTLRGVAREADTSTQMVYTLFGGLGGLEAAAREVVLEGLDRALEGVSEVDVAVGELLAALEAEPGWFDLLFLREGQGPVPPPEGLRALLKARAGRWGLGSWSVDEAALLIWAWVRGEAALTREGADPSPEGGARRRRAVARWLAVTLLGSPRS